MIRELTRFFDAMDAQGSSKKREEAENQQWIRSQAERFKPVLQAYLSVPTRAARAELRWRQDVTRGDIGYTHEADTAFRNLYSEWLNSFGHVQERLEFFSRHGVTFPGFLDVLTGMKSDIQEVLRKWARPLLSAAPGLRLNLSRILGLTGGGCSCLSAVLNS